jgi:hypothetical protein
MIYVMAERPAWTVREGDKLPGLGRIRSVSQLMETDAVCIVYGSDGEFAIYNANEKIPVLVRQEGI